MPRGPSAPIRMAIVIPIAIAIAVAATASRARGDEPAARLDGARNIDGDEAPGYVAFTFDDGPHHESTPRILELLDEAGIKAAFFVVGHRFTGKGTVAEKNRAVLHDLVARGHLVGNHTFRHTNLRDTPEADALGDVDKNQRALKRVLGDGARLFRAPFGATSPEVKKALRARGYVTVNWSVDSGDFKIRTPEKLAERVVSRLVAAGGGVVLMHDTKTWSVEAFRLILAALDQENCRRLDAGDSPIIPVELDYFARGKDGRPLPIPDDVAAREQAARDRLATICKGSIDRKSASD